LFGPRKARYGPYRGSNYCFRIVAGNAAVDRCKPRALSNSQRALNKISAFQRVGWARVYA
jgi:hypothetical protein